MKKTHCDGCGIEINPVVEDKTSTDGFKQIFNSYIVGGTILDDPKLFYAPSIRNSMDACHDCFWDSVMKYSQERIAYYKERHRE